MEITKPLTLGWSDPDDCDGDEEDEDETNWRCLEQRKQRFWVWGEVTWKKIEPILAGLYSIQFDGDGPSSNTILHFNSEGGDFYAGLALGEFIRTAVGMPIVGVADGNVASAAFYAFACCHFRMCVPAARFTFHGSQSNFGYNGSNSLPDAVKSHIAIDRATCKVLGNHTGVPYKKWWKIVKSGRNWSFGAAEARQMGIVDHIRGIDDPPPGYQEPQDDN